MRAAGLRGISREKTRKTTTSDGAETERPADLVERQFVAAGTEPAVGRGPDLRPHALRLGLRRVRPRRVLPHGRRLAGVDQPAHRPGPRRPRHGPVGPPAGRPGRHRPDPSQRPRSPISSHPLHRAARRSRGRRIRRQQGRSATTTRWPRRSTRCSRPSASATPPCDPRAAGRPSATSRSPSPNTSTGSTTAASTARSDSSRPPSSRPTTGHHRATEHYRLKPRPHRGRIQLTEPPRNPGRFSCYQDDAAPSDALAFHRDLTLAIRRLRDWTSTLGCTRTAHRDPA